MLRAASRCNACLRYFIPGEGITICDRCYDKIFEKYHITD